MAYQTTAIPMTSAIAKLLVQYLEHSSYLVTDWTGRRNVKLEEVKLGTCTSNN